MYLIGFLAFVGLLHVSMAGWNQVASQGSDSNAPPPREPIAGGRRSMNLNDPEVRAKVDNLAAFGLQQINAQSNSLYRQTLLQVTDAQSQVVAGILYHITFKSGQSTCRNTPVSYKLFSPLRQSGLLVILRISGVCSRMPICRRDQVSLSFLFRKTSVPLLTAVQYPTMQMLLINNALQKFWSSHGKM